MPQHQAHVNHPGDGEQPEQQPVNGQQQLVTVEKPGESRVFTTLGTSHDENPESQKGDGGHSRAMLRNDAVHRIAQIVRRRSHG